MSEVECYGHFAAMHCIPPGRIEKIAYGAAYRVVGTRCIDPAYDIDDFAGEAKVEILNEMRRGGWDGDSPDADFGNHLYNVGVRGAHRFARRLWRRRAQVPREPLENLEGGLTRDVERHVAFIPIDSLGPADELEAALKGVELSAREQIAIDCRLRGLTDLEAASEGFFLNANAVMMGRARAVRKIRKHQGLRLKERLARA